MPPPNRIRPLSRVAASPLLATHTGAMPPRGGGSFTDDQVRALAAYVFALSQQGES